MIDIRVKQRRDFKIFPAASMNGGKGRIFRSAYLFSLVAVAESLTGGMVASELVSIP